MKYRIHRWSALKQRFLFVCERETLVEAQIEAIGVKLGHYDCCMAIEKVQEGRESTTSLKSKERTRRA